MTDREALERAVILSPLDDLPRLVYADWLDENGESERAEFVRCQVEMERIGQGGHNYTDEEIRNGSGIERDPVVCGCDWCRLRCRADDLLHKKWPDSLMDNETAWIFSLLITVMCDGQSNRSKIFRWDFSRGFPSRVTLPDLAAYERHGREIVSRAPVTEIIVADREPYFGGESWSWYNDTSNPDRIHPPSDLPTKVYQRLDSQGHYWFSNGPDDRDSALTAAARAFADEARHQANLPPVWCGALAGG